MDAGGCALAGRVAVGLRVVKQPAGHMTAGRLDVDHILCTYIPRCLLSALHGNRTTTGELSHHEIKVLIGIRLVFQGVMPPFFG
ncbi:MAG: hypothetical protein ACOX8I_06375, partial [Bacillota bacterium]